MLTDYTVIDLESTGLDPMAGRITEFAARRYCNGKFSPGALAKMAAANTGRPKSAENRAKQSTSLKATLAARRALAI